MKKLLPLGIMNYQELMKKNYYAVDKTLMIKDFLDTGRKVTLITRPRRFGKTLNMSMMAEFFDITKDSKDIFKNTNIMTTEYANKINQYPTIFITFANAKGSKTEVVRYIKQELIKLYKRNHHVFNDLDGFDQLIYQNVINELSQLENGSIDGMGNILSFLMERMEDYYQKKVIVLIDEYDTLFIEAHVNGFYVDIRNGLASILHQSLKTSTSLEYAMLTGIQRVAKENIFSDLNNLVVCTVKDEEYSQYFGFDEKETKRLLDYYDLEFNNDVKEMYDGYHIGNQEIYNPWSIINYASRKKLESYWVNTSANVMIKNAIRESDESFHSDYETLIRCGKLETQVALETSFYEQSSTPSLWGLLVNAGYLTIEKTVSSMDSIYEIRIPNQEVQREFISLTEYYLSIDDAKLSRMMRFLMDENKEMFLQEYQNILKLASHHDLVNENSYHMMMLGMCVCLSNNYNIKSNRETGNGRCDIILKPKKENRASYVLEFKYLKKDNAEKEKLDKLADEAIDQIIKRKYGDELKGKVNLIGLAHAGKNVSMKWIEKENL